MAALFTAKGAEDAALWLVLRHLIDEIGRCCPDGPVAYRQAFLELCVESAELATIEGEDAEDGRTKIIQTLADFIKPA